MLQLVNVGHKSLADYASLAARGLMEEIRRLAEPLAGKRVAHVSATAFGGGVAEINYTLVPLMQSAGLEVEWWRVHREHQHQGSPLDRESLVAALAALYGYVYSVPEDEVRVAAEQRALAMDHSDRWVNEGCDPQSPLIDQERAALVRSYAGLLAAVHRS